MSESFCTIITSNYIGYARALEKSVYDLNQKPLCILISEWKKDLSPSYLEENKTNCYYLDDLCNENQLGRELYLKYHQNHISEFRWAMKGVFVNYLLDKFEKVIFVDGDMYFYNSTQFLWDLLDNKNLLLTPHWRNIDVNANTKNEIDNFELLHIGGLYNAGFIAANRKGRAALKWLSDACLYRCEIRPKQGHFGDQTYLNMLPIYFEDVHILKHQGCNIASWNSAVCRRTTDGDTVLINNKFPVIFIHFTRTTIFDILSGKDEKLTPHLDEYLAALEKYGVKQNMRNEFNKFNNSLKQKAKKELKPHLKKAFPNWALLK